MAIQWGSWTGSNFDDFRVGIDLSVSGTTITAKYYVGCRGSVSDNQTLHKSDAISGTTNYTANISSGGGTQHIVTNSRTGSRGTTYTFDASISGIYSGVSPSKNNASITVPAVKPSKVSTPTVNNKNSNNGWANVNWSAPYNGGASITSYDVLVERPNGTNIDRETSGTDGVQRMEGLDPGSSYTARVRARNSKGWGPWSNLRSFSMAAIAPSAPQHFAHSNIGTTSVRNNYNVTNDGGASIDQANLRRANNSGMSSNVHSYTDGSGFTWYDGMNDLSPGTKYYTDVRVHNSAGWSPRSIVRSFTTLAELPVVGDAGDALNITGDTAEIATPQIIDNGGESPTNVRVQYNTVADEGGSTTEERGSFSAQTIDDLTPTTEYFYRQAVWNSAGWSGYSPWRSFTTLTGVPSKIATPLAFSLVDDFSFRVDWVAPNMNGATFETYRIEVSEDDSFVTLKASGNTTALFAVIMNLTPGITYYVRVRAEASPSNGGWGVDNVTTTGITPEGGLRVYTFIGGVRKQGELYTFVNGDLKPVRPMYVTGGVVETE